MAINDKDPVTNLARQMLQLDPYTLNNLPKDICIQILTNLDVISASRLSCVSKRWLSIATEWNVYRYFTKRRFRIDLGYHDARIQHEPLENTWKAFYERLDKVCCGWRGWAQDAATNDYEPYEMELVIQSTKSERITGLFAQAIAREGASAQNLRDLRNSEIHGICRWRFADDAYTRVLGSVLDSYTDFPVRFCVDSSRGRPLLRNIVFDETFLIRGSNIAIPNRYYGFIDGFVIIGAFDPGESAWRGVFCLVMEESIKIPQKPIDFFPGQYFSGFIVQARFIREAYPCFLYITESGDTLRGIFHFSNRPSSTTCNLQHQTDWNHVSVQAELSSSTECGLTNVLFAKHPSDLIPTTPLTFRQTGEALIGMYKLPILSCVYLIKV
jgi:hypothetical protein